MSCPACEENRLRGKQFCNQCGAALHLDDPPAPAQPSAQTRSQRKSMSQTSSAAAPDGSGRLQTAAFRQSSGRATEPAPAKKPVSVRIAAVVLAAALIGIAVLLIAGRPRAAVAEAPADAAADEIADEPAAESESLRGEVLLDNDWSRITLEGMEETDGAVQFSVRMENKADVPYLMHVGAYALNEIVYGDFLEGSASETVDPGQSVLVTFPLSENAMERLGEDSVGEVTFHVESSKSDGSDGDSADTYVKAYPTGLSAFSFVRPAATPMTGEQVAYDDGSVRIMIGNCAVNAQRNYVFRFVLENNSDASIFINTDNYRINGIEIDKRFFPDVIAGHILYEDCWFTEAELKSIGLTPETVQSIGFSYVIQNQDTGEKSDVQRFVYYP